MSNKNVELASQCWCDSETKNIKIDTRLAIAFSKRLDDKDKKLIELQDFAIWLTGCGYDFTQHEYYLKNKHLFTD